MPRKPYHKQRGDDLSTRTKNYSLANTRRDIRTVNGWKERYFVGKYIGVLRLNGHQPLIHNGRKAR